MGLEDLHETMETYDQGEKESKDTLSGERGLWRAVIAQAVLDATNHTNDKKLKLERVRALSWLSGLSPDFEIVCAMAGLDTQYVIQRSAKAIKYAHHWRRKNYGKTQPKHVVAKKVLPGSAARDACKVGMGVG
jgi:hypothetical protein